MCVANVLFGAGDICVCAFVYLSVDLMAYAGTCVENTELIKARCVIPLSIPARIFRGLIFLDKCQINHSAKLKVKPIQNLLHFFHHFTPAPPPRHQCAVLIVVALFTHVF